jgi:hypothetical protein
MLHLPWTPGYNERILPFLQTYIDWLNIFETVPLFFFPYMQAYEGLGLFCIDEAAEECSY